MNNYYISGTDHYGQDLEIVEIDRLSFVIQQVIDILLEKSLINNEHLNSIEIVINSFINYLQRLQSSIPLGSVISAPKMSVEIILLYGLSKLYVRSEPHVSIGLKILLPLLAKLRVEDNLLNSKKLETSLGIQSIVDELDLGSTIPSDFSKPCDIADGVSANENGAEVDENSMEVYESIDAEIENVNEQRSEKIDRDTEKEKEIEKRIEVNSEEGKGRKQEEDEKEVEGEPKEGEGEKDGTREKEEYGPEEVGKSVSSGEDKRTIDKQMEKKEREEEEEMKIKQEGQIFILRQRLRIAEELTHIGKKSLISR